MAVAQDSEGRLLDEDDDGVTTAAGAIGRTAGARGLGDDHDQRVRAGQQDRQAPDVGDDGAAGHAGQQQHLQTAGVDRRKTAEHHVRRRRLVQHLEVRAHRPGLFRHRP
jgi:hypothetical protein